MDFIDDDAGPKQITALANPPSVHCDTSGASRGGKHLFGYPVPSIVLRVKDREVLADYFVIGVPFDTFSTRIPGRDKSILVEHKNRIVGHALDEVSKLPLAVVQPGKYIPNFLGSYFDSLLKTVV